MTKLKRILVTGGAGFIASHVADQLVAGGHDVAVVDNLSMGKREYVPAAAQFYAYDIKSPEIVEFIRGWRPQVILHFAAQMSVQASVSNPVFDAQENILGSLNLLQAAAEAKVEKFIFSSTGGAIYGDDAPLPAGNQIRPAREEAPYRHRQAGNRALPALLSAGTRHYPHRPALRQCLRAPAERHGGSRSGGHLQRKIFGRAATPDQRRRLADPGFRLCGGYCCGQSPGPYLPSSWDFQYRHRAGDGYPHRLSPAPGTPGLSPRGRYTAPPSPGNSAGASWTAPWPKASWAGSPG